jgi:hypothetical protein
MPVIWEIRDSVLVVTLVGACGDDATTAISAAMQDGAFKPDTSLLLDLRRCTDRPSGEELRGRAQSLAARRVKGLSSRCAFVVGPSAFEFGLARMATAYVGLYGMTMDIFTDPDEAIRWLTRRNEPEPVTRT